MVTSGGRRMVQVLARAFACDPWMCWSLPDPGSARSLLSLFLRTVAFPYGRVLVSGDPVDGVAVLLPPDLGPPVSDNVGAMVMALHGRRLGPALDADAIIQEQRREDGTWTLHTIAVDPSRQGQGVGSALLAEAREVAGRDGLSLETSDHQAMAWYGQRGLAVRYRIDLSSGHGLGDDAPTVWLMTTS